MRPDRRMNGADCPFPRNNTVDPKFRTLDNQTATQWNRTQKNRMRTQVVDDIVRVTIDNVQLRPDRRSNGTGCQFQRSNTVDTKFCALNNWAALYIDQSDHIH